MFAERKLVRNSCNELHKWFGTYKIESLLKLINGEVVEYAGTLQPEFLFAITGCETINQVDQLFNGSSIRLVFLFTKRLEGANIMQYLECSHRLLLP